jgi:hypothetical protein
MAPAREVAEPLRVELACTDLLGESRTQSGFREKNQYRGPSRVDFQPEDPYFAINE